MKMNTIMVPVDFSPSAMEAASTAYYLARREGGRLVFVHVIDAIYYDYGWLAEGTAVPKDVVSENKRKVQERLDALLTVDDASGIEVETHVREGVPFQEIVKLERELQPDLIVLGTHGRRGFSHFFMGSVAEKVVQLATCPVLTVKAQSTRETLQRHHEELD